MAELGLQTTFENSWSITKADYNTMMYVRCMSVFFLKNESSKAKASLVYV